MGLGLAIGVVSAFGSMQKGRKQAKLSRAQARAAQEQAYGDEQAQRREAKMLLGAQAAAMAQSGTGVEGTNEQVLRQSAALAELDALNIRYRGLSESYGLRKQASAQKRAGDLSAGLGLLKGAAG